MNQFLLAASIISVVENSDSILVFSQTPRNRALSGSRVAPVSTFANDRPREAKIATTYVSSRVADRSYRKSKRNACRPV